MLQVLILQHHVYCTVLVMKGILEQISSPSQKHIFLQHINMKHKYQGQFLKKNQAAFVKITDNNTAGIKTRHWTGGLAQGNTGIHKSHDYLSIYFQIYFHSAGDSSVPSGAALGSRKSGCCSSFRYLGGVRMWVEPTRYKSLRGQQGLNSG